MEQPEQTLGRRAFLGILSVAVISIGYPALRFAVLSRRGREDILWRLFLSIGREWKLMAEDEIESRKAVFDAYIAARLDQGAGPARNLVREFAQLHLISGGFRRFGYHGYFGRPDGPLLARPYR
jgi:hypothetical protein